MSTALVLDRTFHVYRNQFQLLAGIGALLPALLLVLRLAFVPLGYPARAAVASNQFQYWTVVIEYFASWLLIYVIGNAITCAATVHAVSRLNLGQSVTIGESYRKTLPRFWAVLRIALNIYFRVVGAGILGYVTFFLVVVGAAALLRFAGGESSVIATVIVSIIGLGTFLLGVFWMLSLYAKYCLAIPACILEGLPARQALRRGRFLAHAGIRRITLIYLLMAVMTLGLTLVLWLPSQIYEEYFPRAFLTYVMLRSIGSFIAGVLAGPIGTIAVALMYYDQRIRKEALDLQVMMDALAQSQPEQPSPTVPGTV